MTKPKADETNRKIRTLSPKCSNKILKLYGLCEFLQKLNNLNWNFENCFVKISLERDLSISILQPSVVFQNFGV